MWSGGRTTTASASAAKQSRSQVVLTVPYSIVAGLDSAAPLSSPAYDAGATEAELRAQWLTNIIAMNEGWQ